jgi:hypothetical protein
MNNNIFTTVPIYDPSDPQNLKVQKIEATKERNEFITFKDLLIPRKLIIQAYLFQLLKNHLKRNLVGENSNSKISDEHLVSILCNLRTLLDRLKKENLSESAPFALELSSCWLAFLHAKEIEAINLRKGSKIEKIEELFRMIQSFPKNSDHKLGYYLSQYTGNRWLPFPFMEILKNLHEEALIEQGKSSLHQWTSTLNEIVVSMQV